MYDENIVKKSTFWDDASKYAASVNHDESFVSEIAYMMVTLHRTVPRHPVFILFFV